MRNLWDFIALALVVAIIYVLVRPQSQAAALVQSLVNMFVGVARAATDLASPAQGG